MKRRHSSDINAFHYASESEENRSEQAKWPRVPLYPEWRSETHAVTFQQMDIQYVMLGSAPQVRLFGCTRDGLSVACTVCHFMPYLYVALPVPVTQEEESYVCESLREALEAKLPRDHYSEEGDRVVSITVEHRKSIMHYQPTTQPFAKVTLASPKLVPTARRLFEVDQGFEVPGLGACTYTTFESNVPYVLRYMVDAGIGGGSWVTLPAGAYTLVADAERLSRCSLECIVDARDVVAHPVDDEAWCHFAPLRLLSFDIECAAQPGRFPDPLYDPVIQIANYVSVLGVDEPVVQNIFMLDTCSPIAGQDVRCYRTEEELLMAWSHFVCALDPDLITGYNIVQFDFTYLVARAAALRLDAFPYFSRLTKKPVGAKDTFFSSAQTGKRESKEWFIDGRVVFDMYQVIQRDHKLSSYTLNNVCAHFLKQQKEDVHHSMITKLHQGTASDRRRLAVYCCKDAFLPHKLMTDLVCLISYIEMARVTGVPLCWLLTRGQGIKVTSQILRKSRTLGYLVPAGNGGTEQQSFKGATVLSPKCGFYEKPVATLDFSSLYPSIMQAHNLCYTTYLPDAAALEGLVEGVDYEVTPIGCRFIRGERMRGILPQILDDLLGARGRAKELMATAPTKFLKQVYNGRQLALKVTANSVYGFTGQSVGSLPLPQISASVTGFGREMIELTAKTVMETYCVANGYAHDADVLYGDTDSVMVLFGVDTVPEALALGKQAAALVTTKFQRPIKLEFEKVYCPWLLMSKKRYGGLFWTRAEKYDKMDCKGIESVRRDNCGIVRYAVDQVLQKILKQRDIEGAVRFSQSVIEDILMQRIDLSLLITTKSYSRDAEDYKTPQAHVELAKRMAKRDPTTAPRVGERIPFVMIQGEKKSKAYEKAEDPLYVLANDVPLDTKYYIDHLVKPLCRVLKSVVENPEAVLTTGVHTHKMVIPRAKSTGGLANFVVVREQCLGCKAPLPQGMKTLCPHCRANPVDHYMKQLAVVRQKEMEVSRLWTQCQSCQGNMHMEVICVANDCPIFYKRVKARKELDESQKTLSNYDTTDW